MSNQQITEFQGEYRFLSNFFVAQINVGGQLWPSTENAYQAIKSSEPDVWRTFLHCTPGQAKRLGKYVTLRSDWNDIKLDVMREITAAKYDQHDWLRDKLMATKGMELIEGNTWGDRFWGMCNGQGLNHLGRIIMDYRDR